MICVVFLQLGSMKSWIYDRNPVDGLRFEVPLRQLKSDIANGIPVFEIMVREYLLNNKHRVAVTLVPDTELEKKALER
jgi:Zn-dependent M16 (insulinase) family peptidase